MSRLGFVLWLCAGFIGTVSASSYAESEAWRNDAKRILQQSRRSFDTLTRRLTAANPDDEAEFKRIDRELKNVTRSLAGLRRLAPTGSTEADAIKSALEGIEDFDKRKTKDRTLPIHRPPPAGKSAAAMAFSRHQVLELEIPRLYFAVTGKVIPINDRPLWRRMKAGVRGDFFLNGHANEVPKGKLIYYPGLGVHPQGKVLGAGNTTVIREHPSDPDLVLRTPGHPMRLGLRSGKSTNPPKLLDHIAQYAPYLAFAGVPHPAVHAWVPGIYAAVDRLPEGHINLTEYFNSRKLTADQRARGDTALIELAKLSAPLDNVDLHAEQVSFLPGTGTFVLHDWTLIRPFPWEYYGKDYDLTLDGNEPFQIWERFGFDPLWELSELGRKRVKKITPALKEAVLTRQRELLPHRAAIDEAFRELEQTGTCSVSLAQILGR